MEETLKKKIGPLSQQGVGLLKKRCCRNLSSLDQDGELNPIAGFPASDPMILSRRITSAAQPFPMDSYGSTGYSESIPSQATSPTITKGGDFGDYCHDHDEELIVSDIPTGLRAQRETLSTLQKENFNLKLSIHSYRKLESIRDVQLEETSCALQEAESKKQELENRLKLLRDEIVTRYHELERLVSGQLGKDGKEEDTRRGRSKMVKMTRMDRRCTSSNDQSRSEATRSHKPTDILPQILDTINECSSDQPSHFNHQKQESFNYDGPEYKTTAIPTHRHALEQGSSKSGGSNSIIIPRERPLKVRHLIWRRLASPRKVSRAQIAQDLATSGSQRRKDLARLSEAALGSVQDLEDPGQNDSFCVQSSGSPQQQRIARFLPNLGPEKQSQNLHSRSKFKADRNNIWKDVLNKVSCGSHIDRVSKPKILSSKKLEDEEEAYNSCKQNYDVEDVDRFKKLLTGDKNKKTGKYGAGPLYANMFRTATYRQRKALKSKHA